MSTTAGAPIRTKGVYEQEKSPQRIHFLKYLRLLVCAVLTCVVLLTVSPHVAQADTPKSITNNITDTENLLGANIGDVTDAIDELKKSTGVTLNLLYLPSFDSTTTADVWAAKQLELTNPKENTVLLAVASEEGKLAVVVSTNSDLWLRDKAAVESFSDAANGPLVSERTPNWSASAIALAKKIEAVKQDNDSRPLRIGLTIGGIVVGVLVLISSGFLINRYLKRRKSRRRHARGVPPTARTNKKLMKQNSETSSLKSRNDDTKDNKNDINSTDNFEKVEKQES